MDLRQSAGRYLRNHCSGPQERNAGLRWEDSGLSGVATRHVCKISKRPGSCKAPKEGTMRSPLQRVTLALFSLQLAVGATLGGNQSVLNPQGPLAERISQLWWYMFWVLTAGYVLTLVILCGAVWRGKRGDR